MPARSRNNYAVPPNLTIKNTEHTDPNVSVSSPTTRGLVTFAEDPSVSAAHVIPSVQSGKQGEGSGAWRVLVEIAGMEMNATVVRRYYNGITKGLRLGINCLRSHGHKFL